jgi:phosphoesterase RecJ-like protein
MKDKINILWKAINKSHKILLINHVRMDMDAFWSLCAMYDILKQIWKDVKAINDEVPLETYAFTWYNEIIDINLNIKEFNPELIISFDAASLDQLWSSYSKNIEVFNKTDFYVIDHHKTNPWFWKINIIDTDYSSTCELTYDILKEIKLDKYITPKIATSLLSWIYTDTNIFYNSNTTKNTYIVAWELLEYWADFRKPYFEFYKKKTFSQSKLWWEILANHMKSIENWKIVYACIDKNIFEKTNSNDRQLTWLISEFFSNIEWVEICFISYVMENNTIKTSLRCNENYDVSKISSIFWWWWHKQAAWFNSDKSMTELEKIIINELKKEFK